MLITGARVATSAAVAVRRKLWLSGGLVHFSPSRANLPTKVDLTGFLILPGLINAHDHLEFNLFPRLGRGPYPNAAAWANDIFHPRDSPIREQLAIPKSLRLIWGGLKNLVSGVTTVAHHNSYHPVFQQAAFPVRVLKRYGWAHSLQFSPDWLARFRGTPDRNPFFMHACEGTGESSRREIQALAEARALRPSTVLVHGVALQDADIPLLTGHSTSLVWCPTSNYFTLGRTVHPGILRSNIAVALATDSGMTGRGDLLDEFHQALSFVDAERAYHMVTLDAAKILKLPAGFGAILDGGPADFTIFADAGKTPAETLMTAFPHAAVVGGALRLASSEFADASGWPMLEPFQPLDVDTRRCYLIRHDIRSLLRDTKAVFKGELRLAGKAVAA